MFDLQVLAYQTDLTRVVSFMISREYSGRTYPQIGVPEAHHPTSHHQHDPDKLDKLTRINTYHVSLLAYYLDKLRATPDGDGTLLDHVTVLYGGGLSDSNRHSSENLPILLAGGGAGHPPWRAACAVSRPDADVESARDADGQARGAGRALRNEYRRDRGAVGRLAGSPPCTAASRAGFCADRVSG